VGRNKQEVSVEKVLRWGGYGGGGRNDNQEGENSGTGRKSADFEKKGGKPVKRASPESQGQTIGGRKT